MRSTRFVEAMVLTIAILSSGVVFLDQTAVNVALPAIQTALNADFGALQWILDIYLLVLSVLMLIGGVLGDIYGRVRVYVIGMVIFALASIVCGLAPDTGWLITGRFFQGVGGALIAPAGLAIISAVIPPDRRGRMLGIWGTFSPLITVSGPLVGGWLVDNVSWRAIFFINIPLCFLATLIAHFYVPENRDETASRQLDWMGVVTLMFGLTGVLVGLIEGPHFGWRSPLVLGGFIIGVLGLIAFVWTESRVENPLIPLSLFKIRPFTGVNLLTVIMFAGLGGPFFFLTLNFQQVQGYSAAHAGLATIPTTIAIFLLSRFVGQLADKYSPRPILILATLLMMTGFFMFSRIGIDEPYWTVWFPAILVYGLGLATMVVPLTTIALGALPQRQSGIASGINNAASRIGQMLSVAIFGGVMVNQFRVSLINQSDVLGIPKNVRDNLATQARSLGNLQPPAGLELEAEQAIQQMIRVAFVDGFQLVMLLSMILVFISLIILLLTIPKRVSD
ncbi:MAG: MFS transporter [Chloroflexota bacterium]